MILFTSGTGFAMDRVVKRLDTLAPDVASPVFMQIARSTYEPVNCEFVRYCENLDELIAEADLVVCHGGFSCLEVLAAHKPLIVVPRDAGLGEIFDGHQVAFAELLHERFEIPVILDCDEIDADLLNRYRRVAPWTGQNRTRIRGYLQDLLETDGN